jgi:hypothetical protein
MPASGVMHSVGWVPVPAWRGRDDPGGGISGCSRPMMAPAGGVVVVDGRGTGTPAAACWSVRATFSAASWPAAAAGLNACLLGLDHPRRFRGLQRRRHHGEGEEQGDELGRSHVELQEGLGTRTRCYAMAVSTIRCRWSVDRRGLQPYIYSTHRLL